MDCFYITSCDYPFAWCIPMSRRNYVRMIQFAKLSNPGHTLLLADTELQKISIVKWVAAVNVWAKLYVNVRTYSYKQCEWSVHIIIPGTILLLVGFSLLYSFGTAVFWLVFSAYCSYQTRLTAIDTIVCWSNIGKSAYVPVLVKCRTLIYVLNFDHLPRKADFLKNIENWHKHSYTEDTQAIYF